MVFSSSVHEILNKKAKKRTNFWEYIFVYQLCVFVKDLIIGFTSFSKSNILYNVYIIYIYIMYIYIYIEALLGQKRSYRKEEMKKMTEKEEENMRNAIIFFQDNSGAIEIVRNGKSERIYFPILPIKEVLSSSERDEFIDDLPVKQPKAKLDYITENSMNLIIRLRNEYMFRRGVFRYYPVLGAVAKHTELWKTMSFYTAFVLNLLILVSYKNDNIQDDYHRRAKDPVIGYSDVNRIYIYIYI